MTVRPILALVLAAGALAGCTGPATAPPPQGDSVEAPPAGFPGDSVGDDPSEDSGGSG
jgi:hypothetical protein